VKTFGPALARVLLLLVAIASSAGSALVLSGCPSGPPTPAPVTPPAPGPVDPVPPWDSPDAGPAATPCQRACAKADELDCDHDGAPDPKCPEACERYEALGGAFKRNPECQATARTCAEHKACRAR
jgi:hypothetical protein